MKLWVHSVDKTFPYILGLSGTCKALNDLKMPGASVLPK